MSFQSLSLKIDGLHFVENMEITVIPAAAQQPNDRIKNILEILYWIASEEKDIRKLFQNENECACCDENRPEWLSLSLKTAGTSAQYIYDFKILLTHELVFSERLILNESVIFERNGSEITFPGQMTENLFERSDYLYLPAAADEKTLKFRHLLDKSLAKTLKNA